ncbi:hypothetical protein NQ315_002663 [Exocentrus adspersus]|uniref:Uncharacterized protein n=1 Tax=Exocentrus adspersus TaxID=1586481 RepID=A0AAV8VUC7_9CUCU|nr:hypothetical protein NQ315_002663 [Exocentrus adspersus]
MSTFTTTLHDMFTEMKNKVALSHKDDKRYLIPNTCKTLAWGHSDIPFYETSPTQNLEYLLRAYDELCGNDFVFIETAEYRFSFHVLQKLKTNGLRSAMIFFYPHISGCSTTAPKLIDRVGSHFNQKLMQNSWADAIYITLPISNFPVLGHIRTPYKVSYRLSLMLSSSEKLLSLSNFFTVEDPGDCSNFIVGKDSVCFNVFFSVAADIAFNGLVNALATHFLKLLKGDIRYDVIIKHVSGIGLILSEHYDKV